MFLCQYIWELLQYYRRGKTPFPQFRMSHTLNEYVFVRKKKLIQADTQICTCMHTQSGTGSQPENVEPLETNDNRDPCRIDLHIATYEFCHHTKQNRRLVQCWFKRSLFGTGRCLGLQYCCLQLSWEPFNHSNNFIFNTSLPWVLSSTHARCEDDWMRAYWENTFLLFIRLRNSTSANKSYFSLMFQNHTDWWWLSGSFILSKLHSPDTTT